MQRKTNKEEQTMKQSDYNKFAGQICKLVYTEFFGIQYECVAMVHEDKIGYTADLGHPMIDNVVVSGANHSIKFEEIKSISPASKKDVKMWLKRYKQFHADVITEHGYDSCEENLAGYELAHLDTFLSKANKKLCAMYDEMEGELEYLLKTYGYVSYAKPLTLTKNVDGAYAPTKYDDEIGISYGRVARVVLTELGDLVYATQWDLDNTMEVEDAYQLVEDELNPYDLYELLSTCKQQIERNLENTK